MLTVDGPIEQPDTYFSLWTATEAGIRDLGKLRQTIEKASAMRSTASTVPAAMEASASQSDTSAPRESKTRVLSNIGQEVIAIAPRARPVGKSPR